MSLAVKRAITAAESSGYWKTDMEDVFTNAKLKKAYKVEVNWELVKAQTGEALISGNADAKPEPAPIVLAYLLGSRRFSYVFADTLGRLLKDDMGREAFEETFDKVVANVKLGPKHSGSVSKDGKTLNFNIEVKLDEFNGCDRAVDAKELAKAIEAML